MNYYFFRCETNHGPLNFYGFTDCHNRDRNTLWKVAKLEAEARGIIILRFTAEHIDEIEFSEAVADGKVNTHTFAMV